MRKVQRSGGDTSQVILQEAVDASDIIGRWEYDVPNDCIRLNALAAQVFNIEPSSAASGVSVDVILSGVHPEDRLRTAQQFQRNAQTGVCGVIEYRVCSADGAVRWVVDRGRITLDETGRPLHGRGVLVDVTPARVSEKNAKAAINYEVQSPLVRAAEHSMAARRAILELPESSLRLASDMMLVEIGRMLAREGGD